MNVLEETRSYLSQQRGKLEEERARLAKERDKLTAQIDEIEAVLHQLDALADNPRTARIAGRRTGIRQRVLDAVKAHPKGATAAEVRAALAMTDKSGGQAVSNALSALKRAGKLATSDAGAYIAVS